MSCKNLRSFTKTAWEELDYPISWAQLLASGETISASSWVVPAGLTELDTEQGLDSTAITLGGGTIGQSYTVANRITTSAGRKFERSIQVTICAV